MCSRSDVCHVATPSVYGSTASSPTFDERDRFVREPRKVRLKDLIEYRERQRKVATQALDDMVADAERLGLYDR
jgi:hypothetical protein